MTVPTFVGAGTGVVITTGNAAVTKTCTVGNYVIVHVLEDGTGATSTFAAFANVTTLGGIGGVEEIGTGFAVGSATAARQKIYIGKVTGAAVSVTIAVGASGDDCYCIIYEFAGVVNGTILSQVIENATAGSTTNSPGTSTTIADASVQTLGTDRLALNLVGVNDDNVVGAFTGQTGGTWVDGGSFASATGTDGCIQIQYANMESAATIDGGTYTMLASDAWGAVGFALIPAVAGGVPRSGFVNFQDPGVF